MANKVTKPGHRWKLYGMALPITVLGVLGNPFSAEAIIQHPTKSQIDAAVEQGEEMARDRQPPVRLYAHFGSFETLDPHGFLMTKLGGIAVMSGHFALRGERPGLQDIQRVINEDAMQVVVTVFGDSPTFARESYLLLKQGDRLIKPIRIRADGRAEPTRQGRARAAFRAKIVASFAYGTFSPVAETTIAVFPGVGGKVNFFLDFSTIP